MLNLSLLAFAAGLTCASFLDSSGPAGDVLYLRPIQTCGVFLFCWLILLLTGGKRKDGLFMSLTILGLFLLAVPKQKKPSVSNHNAQRRAGRGHDFAAT